MRLLDLLRDADHALFRRIAGWRSPRLFARPASRRTTLDNVFLFLSRAANLSKLWLAIGAALAGLGGRLGQRAAVRGLASLGVTSLLVNVVVKPAFERKRPSLNGLPPVRRLTHQPSSLSFPSGHAASAFAFATGVAIEDPRAGLPVAALAAGVAYSRIYIGVHYPADVLAGAAFGTAVALLSQCPWPRFRIGEREHPPARVVRRLDTDPRGAGLVVVVNREAGSRLARAPIDALRAALPAVEVVEVEGDRPVEDVMEEAAARAGVLGVQGGDGSVTAAAQAALTHDKPLLVIPAGTLNHLAWDLGVAALDDALRAFKSGEALEIDVAEIDGRLFLNTAGFGAYPRVLDERRRLESRIGRWPAMVLAMVRGAWRARPLPLVIDGRPRAVWTATVGNCCHEPEGLAPSWRPRLDDRRLDVRVLEATGRASKLRAVLALLSGRLHRSPLYSSWQPAELRITSDRPSLRLVRDGETFDGSGSFGVHKRPGSLVVLADDADARNVRASRRFETTRAG